MDDSCAVCAEALEWVAYGPCGHREVCSTCVARLRFICSDRRCCICKTESDVIFVTKALGDFTRMINDFSVLPSELKEGRVGSYWYHEDTQAFFDDVDHYKMIKAMCRLSCSVCDRMDEQSNDGPKRRGRFGNIEQLKGHLFHRHKLLMCSLCLEGRKVFICEQKLYTRTQLNQHISTGDSKVDGSESERGGFMGHPMCEFCRTPFYGDNELYSHMSTEHYTCHICQRQHPGQYEYYKSYDDLEIHFGREHFLCEDEACLAKKFVVFQSEAEMKRHNTMEHGGRMSRSKRNAALQIPTSFRYRRNSEQDRRRGRRQTFQRDYSDNQLSMAIQASYETANADGTFQDPLPSLPSLPVASDHGEAGEIDPIILHFESLTVTDCEPPSRYLQALSQSSGGRPLAESSFPPLPMGSSSSQQKPKLDPEGLPKNSMAAHLRRQNNRNVSTANSALDWPGTSRGIVSSPNISAQSGFSSNNTPASSSSQISLSVGYVPAPSSYANSVQARPEVVYGVASCNSSSARKWGSSNKISHSASAPNLVEGGSFDPPVSDFPPVSASQMQKLPNSNKAGLGVDDVHSANKSLVERIRAALEFDQDNYAAFKNISAEYRQGLIDTEKYLALVQLYGLSHLVYDLARLCPNAQKQKELVDAYNASLQSIDRQENGKSSKKGKVKWVEGGERAPKDILADSVMSTVRKLQTNHSPLDSEVEVLSKDGYRVTKGKSKIKIDESPIDFSSAGQALTKLRGQSDPISSGVESHQNIGNGSGGSKQRKKTSKFLKARLGDGSVAALLDAKSSDPDVDPDPGPVGEAVEGNRNLAEGFPARGVWRNGGGQRLLNGASRDVRK